jgi:hypothetical protein
MAIPSSTYTEIVTTTIDRYSPRIADNVETHNPLLARLRRKGNNRPADGGVKILENLAYAENSTVKWYSGLEALDVSQSDILTSANFDWKQLNTNVVISGLEQIQNASEQQMHNLLESRIVVAEKTMRNSVATALFNSNTENSGKSIGGLQHLVADLPTSGTVGGIDASAQTWWRNQYYDFSAETVTASSSTITHAMNLVYINTERNGDHLDMFVGGSTYFSYYLESLQANQRFMSEDTAGTGFKSLKFWGGAADVFHDSNCSGTRMYGLNTDYIHYRPSSSRNFTRANQKVSINQDAIVVPMFWAGNMTISNRSLQAAIVA